MSGGESAAAGGRSEMNLQVNLIQDSELRSGSDVSPKFMVQIGATIVPVLLILVSVWLYLGARSSREELQSIKAEQSKEKKAADEVKKLRTDLLAVQKQVQDLRGWQESAIRWEAFLSEFQPIVPATMQLTDLITSEKFEVAGEILSRQVELKIRGKIADDPRGRLVTALRDELTNRPAFRGLVESAAITAIREAELADGDRFRVFHLDGKFAVRKIAPTNEPGR